MPDQPKSSTPAQPAQSKPVESATAAPGEQRAASRPRLKASESGDPAVHKALADLQTAQQNLAAARETAPDTAVKDAEQDEKDALKRLHDLGYE